MAVPDADASVAVPVAVDLVAVTIPDDVALEAETVVAMPEAADLKAVVKG